MFDFTIGVDAGGTKTNARLYDRGGEELFSVNAGVGNMLVDRAAAFANIRYTISACLTRAAALHNICVLVGAAGISAGDNHRDLEDFLRANFPTVTLAVGTDGCLAVYASLHGGDGILVISGTGSIAYGKLGSKLERAGGWGNLLGDEGSGYQIARAALAQITREYDRSLPYGACSSALLRHLDTDVFGVVSFVHSQPKAEVAALTKIVEEAAIEGDVFAIDLLRGAGRQLAELVNTVYQKTGFLEAVSVAVSGGVLTKTPLVKAAFEKALDANRYNPVTDSVPAARGAYYYGRQHHED